MGSEDGGKLTLVDMEAGLEHLKRGTPRHTQVLVVIAEPYFRSAETALRTARLGVELGIPTVWAVGNKLRDDRDREIIEGVFQGSGIDVRALVPFDEAVVDADRQGAALLDVAPDSPGVRAISSLADDLAKLGSDQNG